MKHGVGYLYALLTSESKSNPDESRLRKHLFQPEYQTENLLTIPVAGELPIEEQIINVEVGINIIKLIALVNSTLFLHYLA